MCPRAKGKARIQSNRAKSGLRSPEGVSSHAGLRIPHLIGGAHLFNKLDTLPALRALEVSLLCLPSRLGI
jgi:hypothetical protein